MIQEMRTPHQQKQAHRGNGRGMKPTAEKVVRHHTHPAPETAVPYPPVFPRQLWLGLWGGMAIGAVVGLIFGWLLFTGILAPRGWEAIFSLGPFTFHFFWTMLGLLLGGGGTILMTNRGQEWR
ncbi:MAG: hypothetical protein IPM53_28665 [Anaerolineaceae bacterium]|nr:hypothetical protein [Anaerolineaceae bacterium]